MYCGRGLKVGRLCHQIVAGGMVSSGSKKIKKMEELQKDSRTPAAFHMHWTGDKPRKIVKAKMFKLWFLKDEMTASGRATTGLCRFVRDRWRVRRQGLADAGHQRRARGDVLFHVGPEPASRK